MNRRMLLESLLKRLPNEFQEVEYLESSGTQYIDSGISPTSTTEIMFDFIPMVLNDAQRFFGGMDGANSLKTGFAFGMRNDGNLMFATNNVWSYDLPLATNNRTKLEYKNNGELYVNNVLSTTLNIVNDSQYNCYLFTVFYNGSTYYSASIKLYSCKIYDNSVLVRDFVPCYRKADNVAGLYDLVNGVFYTNAGRGTFIVGGNV